VAFARSVRQLSGDLHIIAHHPDFGGGIYESVYGAIMHQSSDEGLPLKRKLFKWLWISAGRVSCTSRAR